MKLLPYQKEGAHWLANKKYALLADEMRVGKTPQAIEACSLVRAKKVLVICPAIARDNWDIQFGYWFRASSVNFVSRKALGHKAVPQKCWGGVFITSYNLVNAEYGIPWDVIILDESHFLKSAEATRSKNILGKNGVIHHAKHVWCLTGTPAMNNASELWTMLYVFGITNLNYERFVNKYCEWVHTPYGIKVTGNKNVSELKKLLSKFMLRRTLKEAHPELPPISYSDFDLPAMSNLDKRYMLDTFPEEVILLEKALANDYPMECLNTLTESTSTLRKWVGNLKVNNTADYLKMMDYDKVVIFGIHRGTLGPLRTLLGDAAVLVDGRTTAKAKANAVKRFQEDKTCKYFIGNIQTAGTNIDLSVSDYVIMVESSWVPGENKQAIMRVTNFNKRKPVFVQFLGIANSIDGVVQAIACRKTKMLNEIFN